MATAVEMDRKSQPLVASAYTSLTKLSPAQMLSAGPGLAPYDWFEAAVPRLNIPSAVNFMAPAQNQ